MKQEVNKFDDLRQLYERFTKRNKENLMETAKRLLEVQKENAVMLADAPIPPNEAEKGNQGLA